MQIRTYLCSLTRPRFTFHNPQLTVTKCTDWGDPPLSLTAVINMRVTLLAVVLPTGSQVPADAGREERPREVLEAPDPADGVQPTQQRRSHHLHQRREEERPLRAGTRRARQPQ